MHVRDFDSTLPNALVSFPQIQQKKSLIIDESQLFVSLTANKCLIQNSVRNPNKQNSFILSTYAITELM